MQRLFVARVGFQSGAEILDRAIQITRRAQVIGQSQIHSYRRIRFDLQRLLVPFGGVLEALQIEERDLGGKKSQFYVLKIVDSGLKVMVPTEAAERVGLRDDQWQFGYQSAGHSPEEWLSPDFKDLVPGLAAAGHTIQDKVTIAPESQQGTTYIRSRFEAPRLYGFPRDESTVVKSDWVNDRLECLE